jgi:hypothetical protein
MIHWFPLAREEMETVCAGMEEAPINHHGNFYFPHLRLQKHLIFVLNDRGWELIDFVLHVGLPLPSIDVFYVNILQQPNRMPGYRP